MDDRSSVAGEGGIAVSGWVGLECSQFWGCQIWEKAEDVELNSVAQGGGYGCGLRMDKLDHLGD